MSTTENIQQTANRAYANRFGNTMRELIAVAVGETERTTFDGESFDQDSALERLQETPLSFEKVITNHRREEIEWEILLGTGGPADRVYVKTDFAGRIESAEYQFQNWFQPWTAAENQDEELVRRFAEIVGFYESEDVR